MSLSRAEIELIVEEIKPTLERATIQRVLEVDERTFVLRYRQPGQNLLLLISTQPQMARLHFVTERTRQPEQPTAFTMLLRKWLDGAFIEAIKQRQGDRIVELTVRSVDPQWIPAEDFQGPAPRVVAYLVIELTGAVANVFLLDAKRIVRGHQPGEASGTRTLRVGAPYEAPALPPAGTKADFVRWQLDSLDPSTFQRSACLSHAFEHLGCEGRQDELTRHLRSQLRQRQRALKKRVANIERDLQKVGNAEQFRRWGELLQAAHGQIKRGAASASVPDYYQEGMPTVEVPLDPARSLPDNIARYFHQYRRYKDATSRVEERLLASMEELELTNAAVARLEASDELTALEALYDELVEKRLISKRGAVPRARAKTAAQRLPYREFLAHSGATILVGRGARHNDALTTNLARGRDIWLHARDWAGAHVVLRIDRDQQPKSEDLLDAATLAAYFSRGKNDTLVDVTYTQAKHVRKPKGFGPGMVTIAGGSTLGISIEPERLGRLLETEIS
ncbi:MAG: NFACT family protein [Bradymonadaceae bacterium]|nr:NFACT family protein [Lujinxingiaceae bacterium]